MPGNRVPGMRKSLDGQSGPTLADGEYGQLDGIWWVHPPGGQVTATGHVIEHEDGTITAEFQQLGKKYRIDRGVWEPPAQA
jgi:hypothetical protein